MCLSATILALQAIYEAAYERYQQQGLEKQKGDFAETTPFESDKLARSRTALRGPTHPISGAHACIRRHQRGSPRPDPLALCTLEAQEATAKGVYRLPHAIYYCSLPVSDSLRATSASQ